MLAKLRESPNKTVETAKPAAPAIITGRRPIVSDDFDCRHHCHQSTSYKTPLTGQRCPRVYRKKLAHSKCAFLSITWALGEFGKQMLITDDQTTVEANLRWIFSYTKFVYEPIDVGKDLGEA